MPQKRMPSYSPTTCYVVAYDIPDDRRRNKVHQILCGFGTWTQYSLFECFLSKKELVQLKAKLARHIQETQDSVRFYPLCAACLDKVETIGGEPPQEDVTLIV
jgi:CRISPR-associated protein Cas2